MASFDYLKPKDLDEALETLPAERIHPIAGGTNLLVDIRAGRVNPRALLDLGAIDELKTLRHHYHVTELGPLLTMAEVIGSPLLNSQVPILTQAALSIGGPQIRNRATLGGNTVSASPAGDIITALVALDAKITLRNKSGVRTMVVEDFIKGPGQTDLHRDELLTQISFKNPGPNSRSAFFKLGRRNALAISIVNLGIVAMGDQDSDRRTVRIALGSVGPKVFRPRQAEKLLSQWPLNEEKVRRAARVAASECSPISDIRASAEYRRAMVEMAVEKTVVELLGNG